MAQLGSGHGLGWRATLPLRAPTTVHTFRGQLKRLQRRTFVLLIRRIPQVAEMYVLAAPNHCLPALPAPTLFTLVNPYPPGFHDPEFAPQFASVEGSEKVVETATDRVGRRNAWRFQDHDAVALLGWES